MDDTMADDAGGNGRVGAFWWLPNGDVIAEAVVLAHAAYDGRYRNGPAGHQELWRRLPKPAELRGMAYTAVPRGRVIQRDEDDVFLVFAAPEIVASAEARQAVERHFGLADLPVRWGVDEHYATQPDLLDDSDELMND